jgi:hypothetical protein
MGVTVNVMPEESFFMKPLVTVMSQQAGAAGDPSAA